MTRQILGAGLVFALLAGATGCGLARPLLLWREPAIFGKARARASLALFASLDVPLIFSSSAFSRSIILGNSFSLIRSAIFSAFSA